MIEKTILDYLTDALPVPVSMEAPAQRPAAFAVVQKTGSSEKDYIRSAMIVVQSYAQSMYGAAELNEAVKAAMPGLTDLDGICSVSLNSDYNFTDTTAKQYRYQAVFDVVHY